MSNRTKNSLLRVPRCSSIPLLLLCLRNCMYSNRNSYQLVVNVRSLSSWTFPFMVMFDWEEGLIPLTQSLHNSSIKSFKLLLLYTCMSSSYYHSMTINMINALDDICHCMELHSAILMWYGGLNNAY